MYWRKFGDDPVPDAERSRAYQEVRREEMILAALDPDRIRDDELPIDVPPAQAAEWWEFVTLCKRAEARAAAELKQPEERDCNDIFHQAAVVPDQIRDARPIHPTSPMPERAGMVCQPLPARWADPTKGTPVTNSALHREEVETLRHALHACADDLISTPADGLAPEYVSAVEDITRESMQWPVTDVIGYDLIAATTELEPDSSRLPEAIPHVLRPLATAALERHAIEIEQESGGDMDAGSAEAAEVERALRLADRVLAPAVHVTARRWRGGWELHVLGSADLVTQVEDIDDAPAMVRDLLETVFPGADFSKVFFAIQVPK